MLQAERNKKAPNRFLPGAISLLFLGRMELRFSVLSLEGQIAGCKAKRQQPVGDYERPNCKFYPGWGVTIDANNRSVRVICGMSNQTRKVVVPTGKDGSEDGNDRSSHQVAEILYRFRSNQY